MQPTVSVIVHGWYDWNLQFSWELVDHFFLLLPIRANSLLCLVYVLVIQLMSIYGSYHTNSRNYNYYCVFREFLEKIEIQEEVKKIERYMKREKVKGIRWWPSNLGLGDEHYFVFILKNKVFLGLKKTLQISPWDKIQKAPHANLQHSLKLVHIYLLRLAWTKHMITAS